MSCTHLAQHEPESIHIDMLLFSLNSLSASLFLLLLLSLQLLLPKLLIVTIEKFLILSISLLFIINILLLIINILLLFVVVTWNDMPMGGLAQAFFSRVVAISSTEATSALSVCPVKRLIFHTRACFLASYFAFPACWV